MPPGNTAHEVDGDVHGHNVSQHVSPKHSGVFHYAVFFFFTFSSFSGCSPICCYCRLGLLELKCSLRSEIDPASSCGNFCRLSLL
jgi:hypothetical protein